MTEDAGGKSALSDQLGQLPEREGLAERKATAAALMAVAREAGMAVQADAFGRGTFLCSGIEVIQRMLAAAQAEERERWTTAAEEMASEADRRFTMDGTTAHWLRALVKRVLEA